MQVRCFRKTHLRGESHSSAYKQATRVLGREQTELVPVHKSLQVLHLLLQRGIRGVLRGVWIGILGASVCVAERHLWCCLVIGVSRASVKEWC